MDETTEQIALQLYSLGRLTRRAWRKEVPALAPASIATLGGLAKSGPMRVSEVADYLEVDQSVASRHVTGLVKRELAESTLHPVDARGRVVDATDEGRRMIADAHRRIVEFFGSRLSGWTDEELTQLAQVLQRLQTDIADTDDEVEAARDYSGPSDRLDGSNKARGGARVAS